MPPRRFLLPGYHPSAGTWLAAGNRFTKLRMNPPLDIRAYRNKIQGVPLTGGQASGMIPASKTLTLSVGPQGLGTTWYPAQITLSTSTGVLDSSTAVIYLGSAGVPTAQVGSIFSGNGVAALAVPPLQPGDFIIVTWSSGHTGDTAALNIIGTQDALTTGRG
jgi:hypothetical protein